MKRYIEAGHDVSIGDTVQMYWTENEGTGQFGPVTYRNLNSIFKGETVKTPEVNKDFKTVDEYQDSRKTDIIKGQCFNQAVDVCLAKGLDFKDNFEEVFNSLYTLAKKVLK